MTGGVWNLKEIGAEQAPNLTDTYVFVVKSQNAVKILSKDHRGTSLAEVYDKDAIGIKNEFIELGLLA